MNPRSLCALFIALLTVSAASAASFEGKVEMKITSNGKPQTISYSIREGQMRMDIPNSGKAGGATMIMDSTKQQMLILVPSQHMYMVQPFPSATGAMGAQSPYVPSGPAAGVAEAPSLGITTEHATVLGYDCIKYVVKSQKDSSVVEMWVTDQLGNFAGLGGMGGGAPAGRMGMGPPAAPQGWEKALLGKGFFPLRVVGTDASGKETLRLEVTAVHKQTMDDSLFAPPDGYHEFNLGSMMGGMGGMGGMVPH